MIVPTQHNLPATPHGRTGRAVRAYVLLETVVATGLLVMGIAALGSQVVQSRTALHRMEQRMQGMMLAEMQLAHLDTGLIEINSVDEIEEQEFGDRFPSWGWRVTTEETATPELFRLTLEILYQRREDIDVDQFDYDEAEVISRFYLFRATPRTLNFGEDLGMTEEEVEEIRAKFEESGLPFDPDEFDPSFIPKIEDSEELLELLLLLPDAFNIDVEGLLSNMPAETRQALEASGILDTLGEGGDEQGGGNQGGGGR